ncbi:MAG: hypothetical protein HY226_03375 [Candidatus Vogelbacteria bacterium]|nr:hypothetical protein [Candidatus Vogelbacteria bacterium]
MWTKIVGAVVALIVVVVAADSFSGDEQGEKDGSSGNDKDSFTPAEQEIRHVELNKPFDIAIGQEVLLPDGESRGYLSFVDMNNHQEFSFILDGVTHYIDFSFPGNKVMKAGGYMIVLLDFKPDPNVEREEIYGKSHYLAKVIISGA